MVCEVLGRAVTPRPWRPHTQSSAEQPDGTTHLGNDMISADFLIRCCVATDDLYGALVLILPLCARRLLFGARTIYGYCPCSDGNN